MKPEIIKKLRTVFSWEHTACRLIAAWCTMIVTTLTPNQDFTNLSHAQRMTLGQVALSTLLFFALFSAVSFFATYVKRIELPTDAAVLLLASTFCFAWWAIFYKGDGKDLFLIALILVYTLFLVYCIRALLPLIQAFELSRPARIGIAIGAGLTCCIMISLIGCLRYKTFSTPNFDFGIFCNMFHNMRETGLPLVTCERDQLLSHFAVHISPAYYLFLPFYWIFPSPLTLQIGQAVVLAAGVIPVYLLAKHFQLSSKMTVLMCLLYAFYPAVSTGCFYDLHENCFLPLFLLLTFYFYESKHPVPMYVCAALVLTVKEDAAIYLLFFALFLLLSERKYLHGGALAAMALGYFWLCSILLEIFGEGMMVNRFDNLIYDAEDGLLGAIKTALVNPAYLLTQLFADEHLIWKKVLYLIQLILPLGLFPFCTKKASRWLLVSPLLINLLTAYVYQYDIGFQYHFGITAFLFYAAAKNLAEIEVASLRHTLTAVAVAACVCCYAMSVIPFASNFVTRWNTEKDSFAQMEAFLEESLPADASVAASTYLLPHIADRSEIYEVYYHEYKTDIEFVVLDIRYQSAEKFRATYLHKGYTEYARLDDRILILQSPEQ